MYKISNSQIVEAENEEEAVAYIGLKMMFDRMSAYEDGERKEQMKVNFNIANLYYEVSGNFNLTKYDKDKLTKGVNGLISAGVVDLIDTDGKGNYALDIVKLFLKGEAFAMMSEEEIHSIFNIQHKQNYRLLRFGAGLFVTINNSPKSDKYKCGFCSFAKMPERTGIEEKSCKRYFKILEENKIIYVCHSKQAKRDKNGQIKNLSNTYGRPCDKKYVDAYYQSRADKEGYDFTKNIDSGKRGVITRRYNKYVNNDFNGDVIELIQDVLAYNEQPYQAKHEECQKDITVFDASMIAIAKEGMKEHWKELKNSNKKISALARVTNDNSYENDSQLDEW